MTPNVRQREREAREGLSVHVETARSVDPAISETETRLSRSKKRSRARSRGSVSRRRMRRIEGRSMTLDIDPAVRSTGEQSVIFLPSRDAGMRHRLFLLLRRIAAFGVASDDTAERVQTFCEKGSYFIKK